MPHNVGNAKFVLQKRLPSAPKKKRPKTRKKDIKKRSQRAPHKKKKSAAERKANWLRRKAARAEKNKPFVYDGAQAAATEAPLNAAALERIRLAGASRASRMRATKEAPQSKWDYATGRIPPRDVIQKLLVQALIDLETTHDHQPMERALKLIRDKTRVGATRWLALYSPVWFNSDGIMIIRKPESKFYKPFDADAAALVPFWTLSDQD